MRSETVSAITNRNGAEQSSFHCNLRRAATPVNAAKSATRPFPTLTVELLSHSAYALQRGPCDSVTKRSTIRFPRMLHPSGHDLRQPLGMTAERFRCIHTTLCCSFIAVGRAPTDLDVFWKGGMYV